jgi:hypothetical protein
MTMSDDHIIDALAAMGRPQRARIAGTVGIDRFLITALAERRRPLTSVTPWLRRALADALAESSHQ